MEGPQECAVQLAGSWELLATLLEVVIISAAAADSHPIPARSVDGRAVGRAVGRLPTIVRPSDRQSAGRRFEQADGLGQDDSFESCLRCIQC